MPIPKKYLPDNTGIFGYVKEPQVRHISATRLFYYTPHFYESAKRFCLKHGITTLPSAQDHGIKYEFDPKAKNFTPKKIPGLQKVEYNQLIFDPQISEKFKKYDTLFVYNHSTLVGILHFTDYNKMPVNIYLYAQIIELEYLLRALAIKNNLTINSLIEFWASKATKQEFFKTKLKDFIQLTKELAKQNKKPDFSMIYLTDLIDLINHNKILKISREIQDIRNKVMHARENVDTYEEFSNRAMLYNLENFLDFMRKVDLLKQTRKEIETLIRI